MHFRSDLLGDHSRGCPRMDSTGVPTEWDENRQSSTRYSHSISSSHSRPPYKQNLLGTGVIGGWGAQRGWIAIFAVTSTGSTARSGADLALGECVTELRQLLWPCEQSPSIPPPRRDTERARSWDRRHSDMICWGALGSVDLDPSQRRSFTSFTGRLWAARGLPAALR